MRAGGKGVNCCTWMPLVFEINTLMWHTNHQKQGIVMQPPISLQMKCIFKIWCHSLESIKSLIQPNSFEESFDIARHHNNCFRINISGSLLLTIDWHRFNAFFFHHNRGKLTHTSILIAIKTRTEIFLYSGLCKKGMDRMSIEKSVINICRNGQCSKYNWKTKRYA